MKTQAAFMQEPVTPWNEPVMEVMEKIFRNGSCYEQDPGVGWHLPQNCPIIRAQRKKKAGQSRKLIVTVSYGKMTLRVAFIGNKGGIPPADSERHNADIEFLLPGEHGRQPHRMQIRNGCFTKAEDRELIQKHMPDLPQKLDQWHDKAEIAS